MRFKILTWGLVYLLLILFPACGKKTPASPDIDGVLSPVVNNFTASPAAINLGESSTLSWSVSHATQITIDNGIGGVSASGTTTVSPEEATTYTLTASNSAGQASRSCTVDILSWAVLELYTTPFPIVFVYILDGWYATFDIIIAETNGVGAQITTVTVGTYLGGLCNEYTGVGGRLNASGTLQIYTGILYSWCRLTEMQITVRGTDDNGYPIDQTWVAYFSWTLNRGQGGMFIRIK